MPCAVYFDSRYAHLDTIPGELREAPRADKNEATAARPAGRWTVPANVSHGLVDNVAEDPLARVKPDCTQTHAGLEPRDISQDEYLIESMRASNAAVPVPHAEAPDSTTSVVGKTLVLGVGKRIQVRIVAGEWLAPHGYFDSIRRFSSHVTQSVAGCKAQDLGGERARPVLLPGPRGPSHLRRCGSSPCVKLTLLPALALHTTLSAYLAAGESNSLNLQQNGAPKGWSAPAEGVPSVNQDENCCIM